MVASRRSHAPPHQGSLPILPISPSLAIIPIDATSPAGRLTIGGRSVLDATVRALRQVLSIGPIILALDGVDAASCLSAIDHPDQLDVRVTPTFRNRWQAVAAALLMEPSPATVLLHAPERPLLTPVTVQALLGALHADGAMLGVAVHETIKRVVDNRIVGTIPRETVHAVQMPCVFRREALRLAVDAAIREGWTCTDELQLARQAGLEVHLVGGQRNNLPIQSTRDARFAELRSLAAGLVLDGAHAAR